MSGAADAVERGPALSLARAAFPEEIAAAGALAQAQAAEMAALAGAEWTIRAPAGSNGPGVPTPRGEQPAGPGSIAAITQAFANGSLDPVALLATLFARIDAIDPALASFVAIDRAGAIAAARASSGRWASGAPIGRLDGVPVGIKDVIDVAGLPTRCHSRVTDAGPAAADAAIVTTLRGAGAVILGKLATHEFAIGGPAFDLPFPPARNPWNLRHHPGGSSSGAGAAVAAGLVPLAIGTDTAGSARNPASACGVVGLKPGCGVLPVEGVVPLAPSLDHVGLLTRSVADMAIAAAALGIAVDDAPVGRVGYVRQFHTRDMTATAETAAALDRVAETLGATAIALPPLGAFALVNRIILQSEGFAAHGWAISERPAELSRLTRAALLPGAFTPAETLAAAFRAKQRLTEAVDAAFAHVDILLTASSMEPACRVDDPQEIARSYMLQARTPFNVTGHPALAMAAGLSAGGLPLSVQFAGRMGEEGRILAAAAAWERAMGGPLRPPSA